MKKTIQAVVFSVLLLIRPAFASLTVDPAEFGGKVSDWLQTVGSTELQKIIDGNQSALISAQGFRMPNFKDYLKSFITSALSSIKFEKRVSSTQQKNTDIVESEAENYAQGIKKYYQRKYELAQEELAEEETNLIFYRSQCEVAQGNATQKKAAYEAVRGKDEEKEKEAFNEYSIAQSFQEDVCNTVTELEIKVDNQERNIALLSEKMSKVGTMNDPRYEDYHERTEAINDNVVEETLYQAEMSDADDWGGKLDIEKYMPSDEIYESFYERYFYNPGNIRVSAMESQTKSDKVMRERNFLLVNTTVHLLQVTASLRREVPTRRQQAEDAFDKTKGDNGEYEAINAFTASKIENARALLSYAKLLSAKLQYAAVHDLHRAKIQLERDNVSPDEFKNGEMSMQHYVLTQEYIDQLVKDGNNAETTNNFLNTQAENTEWRPR